MSDLQNPLFEEEKEFLERKKLEYERALRGDVDHIKDQSVMVGKVALVGAGLAGGVWLISKLIGGKKRKGPKRAKHSDAADAEHEEADHDYEFGSNYHSSSQASHHGYDDGLAHKSAADSAQAFADHHEHTHEADDLGFGSKAAQVHPGAANALTDAQPGAFDDEEFEEDPFQELPYDDSRRLPASHAFDDAAEAPAPKAAAPKNSRSRMIGSVLQAFLQSDTGKVLVAQAAAVAMAVVTKKIGEFFPADKNADLATSPGHAPAETGAETVASPAPSVPSDASNPSQSL